MNHWLLLLVAIVGEVVATSALPLDDCGRGLRYRFLLSVGCAKNDSCRHCLRRLGGAGYCFSRLYCLYHAWPKVRFLGFRRDLPDRKWRGGA